MIRLIRKRNICAATDISGVTGVQTVSVEKIKELLAEIKQLKNCDLKVAVTADGNLKVTVDDITYKTE
ncbi:MAG: hypothetical protein J6U16_06055 [Ruminococcus sp.]|nr:hypothetical protein [Ruminococcus sp.]